MWPRVAVTIVATASLFLVACAGGGSPVAPSATGPVPGAEAPSQLVAHQALPDKTAKPKRLEAIVQIDMWEFHFASPEGEKNPTFRVPAGKTVGLHLHNEGQVAHELAIGRHVKEAEEYGEVLTELVPVDLFFYYGNAKAEVRRMVNDPDKGITLRQMIGYRAGIIGAAVVDDEHLTTDAPGFFKGLTEGSKGRFKASAFVEGRNHDSQFALVSHGSIAVEDFHLIPVPKAPSGSESSSLPLQHDANKET